MKTSTKLWMFFAGLAFVALGILCMADQANIVTTTLGWVVGLVFVVIGCAVAAVWFRMKDTLIHAGWLLFMAIVAILSGGAIIANSIASSANIISYVFAAWLLLEGLSMSANSLDYKKLHFQYWWIMLILGLAIAIFGLCCIINPLNSARALAILIGIAFVIDGIGYWVRLAATIKIEKIKQEVEAQLNS